MFDPVKSKGCGYLCVYKKNEYVCPSCDSNIEASDCKHSWWSKAQEASQLCSTELASQRWSGVAENLRFRIYLQNIFSTLSCDHPFAFSTRLKAKMVRECINLILSKQKVGGIFSKSVYRRRLAEKARILPFLAKPMIGYILFI